MNTTHDRRHPSSSLSPGNEERAIARIERATAAAHRAGEPISTDTARLIAARIHQGEHTALGRFAANGRLYRDAAISELWETGINEIPIGWWRAFDQFLQQPAAVAETRS